MAPLDPSSSKCYNLELPNTDSKDARLRLDVRTGASWMILQSRIMVYGGCTIPLEIHDMVTLANVKQQLYEKAKGLNIDIDTVDFNDYFSNEVFSLNLIERNWTHLRNKGNKAPTPRIFHAMSVYDSYLYIHGGITWNNEKRELELVNDLWRFDLYDQKWQVVAQKDSKRCHRFDHKLLFLPNLEFVGRPRHYGFLVLGGRERDDTSIVFSNLFDLVDEQFVGLSHRFQEASTSEAEETSLSFNETNNTALLVPSLEGTAEPKSTIGKSLLAYLKTPSDSKSQPLITYPLEKDSPGTRVRSNKQLSIRDLRNIPFELNYPSSGYFGDNVILTGFLPGDLNISMFIYNRPTLKWSRVQAFCQHSTWSHRFCKGFVWSSHHKIILLGNNETSLTPPSVQFFNLYLSVSLPFTNALGSFSQTSKSDSESNENKKGTSMEESSDTKTPRSSVAFPPKAKKASTSFAAYSHYIVPNVSITPIAAVFPPYAIALGKDAFERKSSLSDFEFVSSEGDIVPISMNLCRKRWGPCFDRLLAKAYARAIVERDSAKEPEDLEAEKSKTQSQNKYPDTAQTTSASKEFGEPLDRSFTANSGGDSSSSKSSSESQPQFRLPFQDFSTESNSRLSSPQPQSQTPPAAIQVFPPRRASAASNTYYATVSNSRRGSTGLLSPTIPSSRRGSVPSALSLTNSHRDSTSHYFSNNPNSSTSRRNSAILNNTNPFSSQSRGGSVLRRSSVTSSNSTSSSLLSMTPPAFSQMAMSVPPSTQSRNSMTQLDPVEPKSTTATTLLLKSLPDQPPMPVGVSPPPANSSESRLNSEFQQPQGEHPGSDEKAHSAFNADKPAITESQNIDPKSTTGVVFPEDLKLDPKFIPRSMCLPFSTTTTKAFSEFLYTGQVGSNWRVVPTAVEVFMMSKFYEVPLLYDLLSEVFYSILAKKEAQLVKMANQLKFDIVTSEVSSLLAKDDNILGISAIDEYTSYLTKVDDGQLDLTLLKRASKAASSAYSHSDDGNSFAHGSSISTYTTLNDDTRRKSVSLLPTRMRNSIATFASNDSEDYFQKNHSSRSSRSSRRGSRVSNSAAHTPSAPIPRSQLSQSIIDANSSDEQNDSGENDLMKNTIATVNQSLYDSNSSQEESNATEPSNVEAKLPNENTTSEIPLPGVKHGAGADATAKSKKVSDSKNKAWPTFKELSSPDAPPCSDIIVDLLVEAGALDTDMKLMLRALNAKEMAVQLRNQTREFHRLLKTKKETDEKNRRMHTASFLELSKLQRVSSTGVQSKTTDDTQSNTFDVIRRTGSNDLRGQAITHASTANIASSQEAPPSNVSATDLRSGALGSPISKFSPMDPASTNSSELNLSIPSNAKGSRKISSFFKKKTSN